MLEAQSGHRVLNDEAGVTVYETDPTTRFASANATAVRGISSQHFVETFRKTVSSSRTLTDRARVSIDLFNASFFEPAEDMRLVVLVIAVEALLDLAPRSPEATALVDGFIAAVREAPLPPSDQASLKGALCWLRRESIRGAGRRLAMEHLGKRTYEGRAAPEFFAHCYDLRSELVHGGDIRKARQRAGAAVAQLEVFTADLIFAKCAS